MKNAYSAIINHMRTQGAKYNPPVVQVGVVVAADPLTVKLGDLQISKDNLLVADYLLPSYQRQLNIPLTDGSGVMSAEEVGPYGSHTHAISKLGVSDGAINFTDGLKQDDVVALIPTADEQTYIVLARVVSP